MNERVKVMYFASKKPLVNVIGKTKANAAMCGVIEKNPKSTTCL
jgi:hypothetical protein